MAGAVLGIALYGALRAVFGGTREGTPGPFAAPHLIGPAANTHALQLVPTSVAPSWWQVLLVVAAISAYGVVVGVRASSRAGITPYGVTRRQVGPPPRPWGLVLLALDVVAAAVYLPSAEGVWSGIDSTLAGVTMTVVAVVGIVGLSPWAAYLAGRLAERRAGTAPMLLAARRLVADPRPAGRAGASVGGIALVSGGGGVIAVDIVVASRDPFAVVSLLLFAAALFGALLVATGTLAVHSVESMNARRRSIASLSALGVSSDELEATQRCEALLVTLPIGFAGTLLGTIAVGALAAGDLGPGLLLAVPNLVITPALAWLAVVIATSGTRRWALRAAAPANLRTE